MSGVAKGDGTKGGEEGKEEGGERGEEILAHEQTGGHTIKGSTIGPGGPKNVALLKCVLRHNWLWLCINYQLRLESECQQVTYQDITSGSDKPRPMSS